MISLRVCISVKCEIRMLFMNAAGNGGQGAVAGLNVILVAEATLIGPVT